MDKEPDKAKAYDYITQFKLHKICCLTNTETNTYFNKEAQTPTCYFTLEKKASDYQVLLYDSQRQIYVNHKIENNGAIPLFASSIIQKLMKYVDKVGTIDVVKTNMPKKNRYSRKHMSKGYSHKNIKTCVYKQTYT